MINASEREQRDLAMKVANPNSNGLDRFPVWQCPCGYLNQYADTFGELCLGCKADHTLNWHEYIVNPEIKTEWVRTT